MTSHQIACIPAGQLTETCVRALMAAGVPDADARRAADVLVFSDLVGIDTHGVRRLTPYVARIRSGAYNPRPNIEVHRSGGIAVVRGDDGLGPVVGRYGLDLAIDIARETGVSFVGCRDSQHFGALAPYAKRAADAGMVVVLGTTAFPTMAPWGGREVKVGNNPLGIGAPRPGRFPFVLDMAMSVAARGKMRKAHERGEPIPEGWALDSDGRPTTDPLAGLKGYVMPVAGHKGYGLALMVDLLGAVLIAGTASFGVQSLFQQKDRPQKVGHFFICIDPERTIGRAAFDAGIETLDTEMRATPAFDPARPVLLPGDIEAALFEQRMRDGIPVDPSVLDQIERLSRGEHVEEIAFF